MLEIKDLAARVETEEGDGRQILKGVNLTAPKGEVHAVMGPNGCGKSTLSYVLSGREGYEITGGGATLAGADLLDMDPEERAANGVFLSFQYPVEIPGVPTLTFVKEALNAQRRARGEDEVTAPVFMKQAREAAAKLGISNEMLKRPVNVGFSGGEKKRMEIFQALMLEPKLLILD
jgi:Fe-S cluster assembly ATP-binding protein